MTKQTTGAALADPLWHVPEADSINQMTVIDKSNEKVQCTIWGHNETYIGWQLKNVQTKADDEAVAKITNPDTGDSYTDGYAMTCTQYWPTSYNANGKSIGLCV